MAKLTEIQWLVHFSGLVQGVGFRYTTQLASRGFEVVGTVENLPDGRVRMIVEGRSIELERFLQQILATTQGRVIDIDRQEHPATGNFVDFSVVR